MKKLLIVSLIISAIAAAGYYEQHYTRKKCEVINVTNDIVTVEDRAGYQWDFEGKGFQIGDIVNLKMYSKATTNNITDDEVVKVIRIDK